MRESLGRLAAALGGLWKKIECFETQARRLKRWGRARAGEHARALRRSSPMQFLLFSLFLSWRNFATKELRAKEKREVSAWLSALKTKKRKQANFLHCRTGEENCAPRWRGWEEGGKRRANGETKRRAFKNLPLLLHWQQGTSSADGRSCGSCMGEKFPA